MRRRARQLSLALLATLSLPGASSAVELQPSIAGSANFTDNLFSSPNDRLSDVFFAATPGIAIADEGGRLQWSLSYEPSYLAYTEYNELNGWDHDVDGALSWQITPRTTVRIANRYRMLSSVGRFNELSDVAGAPAGINAFLPGRNEFQRNLALVGFEHGLTRRLFLSGSYTNAILEFEREDQPDRLNQEARLSLDYALRKDLRTGVRVGWSQSDLKPENAPNRTGNFYNLSLTTSWTPTPRTTVLASAGPTWVKNDALNTSFNNPPVPRFPTQVRSNGLFYTRLTTCPQLDDGTFFLASNCESSIFQQPQDQATFNPLDSIPQTSSATSIDDESLTFFANLSVVQEWDHWTLRVGYNRQDDQSVSSGVSGVINVGSARLEYEPAPRWTLIASGAYILRESTTDTLANALALSEATGIVPILSGGLVFGVRGAGLDLAQSQARRIVLVNQKSETETWRTFVKAVYQATERVELNGTVLYTTQNEKFNGNEVRDYDRFTAWIGVTYRFAPIMF